jgi:RND superfamily putative drug exporter
MTLIPALMAILGERAWQIPAWLERILPSVDIEGEAVERERHLADWPGDDSVIAADGVTVAVRSQDLDLRVPPGSALVLTGRDDAVRRRGAGARRAGALRWTPARGRAPAAGTRRLGARACRPACSSTTRYAAADAPDPLHELREALRGRTTPRRDRRRRSAHPRAGRKLPPCCATPPDAGLSPSSPRPRIPACRAAADAG